MPDRREDAFTLVELLVAMVISGLVATSVAASVTLALRLTARTEARLAETSDGRTMLVWFSRDIADALSLETGLASCTGDTAVVTLLESSGAAIHYVTVTTTAGSALVRQVCTGSALERSHTIVSSVTAGGVVVTCSGVACLPVTAVPSNVALAVTTQRSGRPFTFVAHGSSRVTAP